MNRLQTQFHANIISSHVQTCERHPVKKFGTVFEHSISEINRTTLQCCMRQFDLVWMDTRIPCRHWTHNMHTVLCILLYTPILKFYFLIAAKVDAINLYVLNK